MNIKTTTLLFLSLILAMNLGCGSTNPQNDLLGKWQLDKESTKTNLDVSEEEGAAMLTKMVDSMELNVEFKSGNVYSGSTSAMGFTTEFTGTWKVVSKNSDSLTIETQDDGQDSVAQRTITFVNRDLMVFDSTSEEDSGPISHLVPRLKRVK